MIRIPSLISLLVFAVLSFTSTHSQSNHKEFEWSISSFEKGAFTEDVFRESNGSLKIINTPEEIKLNFDEDKNEAEVTFKIPYKLAINTVQKIEKHKNSEPEFEGTNDLLGVHTERISMLTTIAFLLYQEMDNQELLRSYIHHFAHKNKIVVRKFKKNKAGDKVNFEIENLRLMDNTSESFLKGYFDISNKGDVVFNAYFKNDIYINCCSSHSTGFLKIRSK